MIGKCWGRIRSIGRRREGSVLVVTAFAFVFLALVPTPAWAQSGIAGIVKDSSGGVLPGVTVEASSPALIEKVRSASTDGQGRYNITDLRPGVYTVTFSLAGFKSLKREALQLPAAFTATVNVDMEVGGLEETLTVTSQAPVLDLQNSTQKKTLSQELVQGVPTGGLAQSYAILIPGVSAPLGVANNVGNSFSLADLSFHGARESQVAVDGFETSHRFNDGTQYMANQAMVQEIVVSAGSAGADQQQGGVVTNMIPKDGGNAFSGQVYFHYAKDSFISNNVSPSLAALGVANQAVRKTWDFDPALGGPIKQDKLWFFVSYRSLGNILNTANLFDTNPSDWVYTADKTRGPGGEKIIDRNYTGRLTWQATPRNKFTFLIDDQPADWGNRAGVTSGTNTQIAPEATIKAFYKPQYLTQTVWRSPVTGRILLEAGLAYLKNYVDDYLNDEAVDGGGPVSPNLQQISATDLDTGEVFRAPQFYGMFNHTIGIRTRAAVSYVTGTHSVKVGMNYNNGSNRQQRYRNGDYTVNLRSGTPASLVLWGADQFTGKVKADVGLYAQDSWRIHRATLNVGLRYDYWGTSEDAESTPATRFVPALQFAAVPSVHALHDLDPRVGVAYDVFGDGKTALKASINRYVGLLGFPSNQHPTQATINSATRTWTDTNRDFVPQCDFSNPNQNQTAGDLCGILSNVNFGKQNPTATTFDPSTLRGFGNRPYNWETDVSVQRQIVSGLGLNVGYYRRWFGNFTVNDNTLVKTTDYATYCVTSPVDGKQLCGFSDTLNRASQVNVTQMSNFGDRKQIYYGYEVSVAARFHNGAQFSGGTVSEGSRIDQCFAVDAPAIPSQCGYTTPLRTTLKLLGVLPMPLGIQLSGSMQTIPGPEISATTAVFSNAQIRPSLGRDLAAGANGTATLNLFTTGTSYASNFTKVDMRFSKIFRISNRGKATASLDAFNLFNSAGVLGINTRYGPSWLNPIQILGGRTVRISGRYEF